MAEAQDNHVNPLMPRFIAGNHFPGKFEETADEEEEEEEEEEIELSLGLSLNGRFGVDPKRAKTLLARSSSISDFMLTNDDHHHNAACVAPPMAYAPLIRTCSLPTETEEEWRKRKEIQSLRRMEAKRKRLEKLKNVRTVRDQVMSVEANTEENVVREQSQVPLSIMNARGAEGSESKGERGGGVEGLLPPPPSSQGSIGSRGSRSSSSGISESESQPTQPQGMNICTEARSPASIQCLPKQNEQKPVVSPATANVKSVKLAGAATENNNEAKEIMRNMMSDMPCVSTRGVGRLPKQNEQKPVVSPATANVKSVKLAGAAKENNNEAKEIMRNMMSDMPCVSTRGVGPNGKRIEGFLYRYRKGEEVRIVCVCHGSFLSPAEFVKHAGGGDVAHPLKHIVVSSSPLL